MPRVGVVGHVEWIEFAVVARLPRQGEIVHSDEFFEEPAGGGAVATVQLRKLAGAATLYTALGHDELGERAARELRERHGVALEVAVREEPQRRGFTFLDADHERTITVLGPRCVPRRGDALPWAELGEYEGVYFTGGDADALRAARAAKVLVATPRALDVIAEAGVQLDVLVGSAKDPGEALGGTRIDPAPRHVVLTRGAEGGSWDGADGTSGGWVAAPLPGAPVDAYGSGDSFAAGLTYGLAEGRDLQGALELAARCGAACLTGRGPYSAQLESARPSAS
ncbi:MAG TPA: PfkB family carbohydrate kinase [Solirubrobacteraceae bacterium]|nr:PfkB family carbohydrate kinase [Solirubrobacteraceae bacterium]